MGEGEVFARNFLASRMPPDAFEAAGADDSVHTKEWRALNRRAPPSSAVIASNALSQTLNHEWTAEQKRLEQARIKSEYEKEETAAAMKARESELRERRKASRKQSAELAEMGLVAPLLRCSRPAPRRADPRAAAFACCSLACWRGEGVARAGSDAAGACEE